MYSPKISKADFELARYEKEHGHHSKIRKRMAMLYLIHEGYSRGLIAHIIDVNPNTITCWVKSYISGGINSLRTLHYEGQKSILHEHKESIIQHLNTEKPISLNQIQALIERHTGIGRSLTQINYFIRTHLGIKRRKIQPLPGGKLSLAELVDKQELFLTETLHPLLKRASDGEIEVFFCDAVHPVQGFHSAYIYSSEPCYLRSAHGRNRFNMLSAIHAISHQLLTIYGGKYVNAETTVELLELVKEFYPNQKLFFIMDNARYQRCKYVQEFAEKHQIKLVFLPAYSPNLNLIERLWKFMKKQVTAGKYYADKESFENAFKEFLYQIEIGIHDDALSSLLSLNFQTFKTIKKSTKLAA